MSEIKTVQTEKAPKAIGPYSQGKIYGGFLGRSPGVDATQPLNQLKIPLRHNSFMGVFYHSSTRIFLGF